MAYIVRRGAPGYPDTGAHIKVFLTGGSTLATGLIDLDGNPLSQDPNGFTVGSSLFWGFEPDDRSKLDVYWVEQSKYLVQNAILKDPYADSILSDFNLINKGFTIIVSGPKQTGSNPPIKAQTTIDRIAYYTNLGFSEDQILWNIVGEE